MKSFGGDRMQISCMSPWKRQCLKHETKVSDLIWSVTSICIFFTLYGKHNFHKMYSVNGAWELWQTIQLFKTKVNCSFLHIVALRRSLTFSPQCMLRTYNGWNIIKSLKRLYALLCVILPQTSMAIIGMPWKQARFQKPRSLEGNINTFLSVSNFPTTKLLGVFVFIPVWFTYTSSYCKLLWFSR